MPDADDIASEIASAALKPQSASMDGSSVTDKSIDDKLKAQAHAAQQGITVAQLFGNRTRLIPGPRQ